MLIIPARMTKSAVSVSWKKELCEAQAGSLLYSHCNIRVVALYSGLPLVPYDVFNAPAAGDKSSSRDPTLHLCPWMVRSGGATVVNLLPETAYPMLLSTDTVTWQPGENGTHYVTLHLPESQASEPPGALLVTVGNVSNADLTLEHSSTVISGIPTANLTTGFAVTPNQVRACLYMSSTSTSMYKSAMCCSVRMSIVQP